MIRKSIAAASLMAVSLFSVAAGAAEPSNVGTADTKVNIGSVSLPGVLGGGAELGWARSFASTDAHPAVNPLGEGSPYAIAGVMVAGEEFSVNSRNGGTNPGQDVDIPGVGTIGIGHLSAVADATSASAAIDAVRAVLGAQLIGMDFGVTDFGSAVDAAGSRSGNSFSVEGISVGLDDILPADLLAALPLNVVMDLLDRLPVDLPLGQLDGALDTVRDLVASAGAVDAAAAAVADLRDARDEAMASRPSLVSAVNAAEAALASIVGEQASLSASAASLESEIATVNGLIATACGAVPLPTCASLQAELNSLTAQLADVQSQLAAVSGQIPAAEADVAAAKAVLAEADKVIDAAEAELAKVVAVLDDALDELIRLARLVESLDLNAVLSAVVDGLKGVELIGIEDLVAGVTAASSDSDSAARAVCQVSGVRVLGQSQPAADCADLVGHLSQVEAILSDVLSVLPIKGLVDGVLPADMVTVAAPKGTATDRSHAVNGVMTALASVSPLKLDVKAIELTGVVDGVLSTVTGLVTGTLADLQGLTGVTVPVDAEAVLSDLLVMLDGLPAGDLLEGLEIPGVNVLLGELVAFAQYGSQSASGTPTPVGTPTGSPGTPVPSESLPTTGGGIGLAALVLLALGGAATWNMVIRPRFGTQ